MNNITLLQIETFLNVAEYLSFSEAAKAMDTSQPSLSQTINRLEEGAGIKLFIRGKHGIELTREGEYLYSELRPLYSKICKAFQNAEKINTLHRKVLRIVCHSSYISSETFSYFERMINHYKSKYPDVTVHELLYDLRELSQALTFGDANMIYAESFALEKMKNLSMKKVAKHRFYVAMSEKHPMSSAETVDIEKLNHETFYLMSLDDNKNSGFGAAEWCKKAGFTPKDINYLPNFPSIMLAVRQGLGMTFCGFKGDEATYNGIKYVPVPDFDDPPYWVAAWRTNDISKEAKDFIDMLPEI
jgi:DNA-binding transcriptional LysR family regulator